MQPRRRRRPHAPGRRSSPARRTQPLRATPGRNVTQMHYARRGRRHRGDGASSRCARTSTPEFVRERGRARPRDHPGERQPPRARADDHRPQLPGEDQREHRQLAPSRRRSRRRSRSCTWSMRVGRRHGDGSLDRQRHPRDARVRSSATRRCRSARCRSTRRSRRSKGARRGPRRIELFLETLIEQAEQGVDYFTIHAGVLLRVRAADREARHRHRLARRLDHGASGASRTTSENFLYTHFERDLRDDEEVRRLVLARRRPAPRLDRRRERRGAVRASSRRSAS